MVRVNDTETTVVTDSGEVGTDGFGVNDYVSRLPNLCLLEIFKQLNGVDISHVMTVNTKMRKIAMDPSIQSIVLAKGGYLTILQTSRGYGFTLVMRINDKITVHGYEIYKGEDGAFVENFLSEESLAYSCSTRPHNWPIPDSFFAALRTIASHYEANTIMLYRVSLEARLFSELQSSLAWHRIKTLHCIQITYKRDSTDAHKRFAEFAKRVKHVDIRASSEFFSVIDEEFMSNVSESNLRALECQYNFGSPHTDDTNTGHVVISGSLFPSKQVNSLRLLNFKKLILPAMVLDPNWIATLFMMFLDNAALEAINELNLGQWTFAVTQPITSETISEQIRESDYKYYNERNEHAIIGKENGLSANFHAYVKNNDDGSAIMHLITVHFKNNRRFTTI